MITVSGIFANRSDAEQAVRDLLAMGIAEKNVDLLTPDLDGDRVATVPTADSEQPGMGRAVGSVVGGAMGVAGGLSLGTVAAASFMVPGIGPVLGLGVLGAAALGLAGGAAGGAVGEKMDRALMDGLPKDEVFLYEDGLRHGRSVVICMARDEAERTEVQRILRREWVESIDAARQRWWTGLRSADANTTQVTPRISRLTRTSTGAASRQRSTPSFAGDRGIRRYTYWPNEIRTGRQTAFAAAMSGASGITARSSNSTCRRVETRTNPDIYSGPGWQNAANGFFFLQTAS